MGRTSLVLAVVAAMVTVLVFAVPAFALPDLGNSDPPGPGGKNPKSPTGADNPPPDMIGGELEEPQPPLEVIQPQEVEKDPQAADGTIGDVVSDYTVHATEVGTPAGHHLIQSLPSIDPLVPGPLENGGDLVQFCLDNPSALACNLYEDDV